MTRHSSPPFLLCESPTSQADAEESLRRHETNSSSAQEKKLEDPRGTRVEPTPTSDTQAHGAYTGSSQRSTQQHGILEMNQTSEQDGFAHPTRRSTDIWYCCACGSSSGPQSSIHAKCSECQHSTCGDCLVEKAYFPGK